MTFFYSTVLFAIVAFADLQSPLAAAVAQNVNTQDMDRSVRPGEDFYRFANGGWLKAVEIPGGQSSYGTSAMLKEKTNERVRSLIEESAAAGAPEGSVLQKVGDYYAAFMDEKRIEATGFTPLADEMATISAISSKASLSAYLGTTLNSEVDGLTSNADHIFGVWVNQGFEDSEHYVFPSVAGRTGHARSRRIHRSFAQNGRVACSVQDAHCDDP